MPVADRAAWRMATLVAPAPARPVARRVVDYLVWPFRFLRRAYSLDLRSLALFRIGLALVLLGDLIARAPDLMVFYTDWGVLPRAALLDKFSPAQRFSVHLMSGQFLFQAMLFIVAALFTLMLLFGVRTKLAAFASWFMLVSVQTRNPEILQGGDVYLRVLVFIAMFLPLGALYSVDSALNSSQGEKRPRNFACFSTPGLALLAQVAFVYAFAVLMKTGTEWRRDFSAVFYALSIQQMSTPVGHFLLHFSKLLPWLTRGTLVHEGVIPLLILTPIFAGPARFLAVLLIMALHIALGLSIRLGHFPYIACMAALPLLPTWFWERRWVRTLLPWSTGTATHGSGLRIYYDQNCPFCSKVVRVFRTLLCIPGAELVPAQEFPITEFEMKEQRSWIVVDPDGKHWYKWRAFAEVISYSPLVAWLSFALRYRFIVGLGDRVYDIVEKNRDRLSRWSDWIKPRQMKLKTSWLVTVCALLFVLHIALWNLFSITRVAMPAWEDAIAIMLDIDQCWDMFAPKPLTYDGWYVIDGVLRDGRHVNVLHPGRSVSYEKPESIADQYKNERWRKYLMNLSLSENTEYRLYYGRYLCRSWNTARWARDPGALVSFDIYFMGRQNSMTDQNRPYSKDLLWHHECFK